MRRIEKVWAALSISSGIGFPFQVTLAQEYGTPNSAMPAIMVTKIGSRCSRDHVERPPTSGNTALFVSLNCACPGAAGCSLAILYQLHNGLNRGLENAEDTAGVLGDAVIRCSI